MHVPRLFAAALLAALLVAPTNPVHAQSGEDKPTTIHITHEEAGESDCIAQSTLSTALELSIDGKKIAVGEQPAKLEFPSGWANTLDVTVKPREGSWDTALGFKRAWHQGYCSAELNFSDADGTLVDRVYLPHRSVIVGEHIAKLDEDRDADVDRYNDVIASYGKIGDLETAKARMNALQEAHTKGLGLKNWMDEIDGITRLFDYQKLNAGVTYSVQLKITVYCPHGHLVSATSSRGEVVFGSKPSRAKFQKTTATPAEALLVLPKMGPDWSSRPDDISERLVNLEFTKPPTDEDALKVLDNQVEAACHVVFSERDRRKGVEPQKKLGAYTAGERRCALAFIGAVCIRRDKSSFAKFLGTLPAVEEGSPRRALGPAVIGYIYDEFGWGTPSKLSDDFAKLVKEDFDAGWKAAVKHAEALKEKPDDVKDKEDEQ